MKEIYKQNEIMNFPTKIMEEIKLPNPLVNQKKAEIVPELVFDVKNSVVPNDPKFDANNWQKIFIKNMVSLRCKIIVKQILENLGLHYSNIELGEVKIMETLSDTKLIQLKANLLEYGLELMEDHKIELIEKIKNLIIEMVHYSEDLPKIKMSTYLSEKLNCDYNYLSHLFSEVKGITIEHFTLVQKIERVKEMLVYDELTLSEISYRLRYSSVAHLSAQFKKITGLTPSHFKMMKNKRVSAVDKL